MAHDVNCSTLVKGGAFLALLVLTSACGAGETPTPTVAVSPTPTPPPSATATVTPTSVPLVSAVEAAAGVKIISGLGPTPTPRPTATPTPDLALVQAQAATPAPTPTTTPAPNPWGLELVGVALGEESESPLAGVYVHGNYAYVGGMSVGYRSNANVGIRIVDLTDPANPELVSRIPLRRLSYFANHSHGDAVATRIETDAFQGDIAIVINGVPDTFTVAEYPQPFGIWDVTDPSDPQFLSVLNLGNYSFNDESGDLGDKPNDSKAVHGQYFYAIYNKAEVAHVRDWASYDYHLAVVDLADPRNPVVVGEWNDTKQVWLFGVTLNKTGTRAYVVGITPPPYGHQGKKVIPYVKEVILYVLDIQNPIQPVEIGRYVYPYPVVAIHGPGAPVANDDDSLLILADGSWGGTSEPCGHHGRLHILDISDLSSIRELSTFKIAESDTCFEKTRPSQHYQATEIVVKGNLVYSTWLNGGLHVIDISDPANPVEVGAFRSPNSLNPPLSDVALYGDHVLATTVWWSGMYILR